MTTQGDVIVSTDGSGTPGRLAVGADNRLLRSDGTDPAWGQIDDPNFFTTGAETTQSLPGVVKSAGQLKGTNTNDDAAAGYVGEFVGANAGTDVTAANADYVELASVTLSAGDWDVEGFVAANAAGSSGVTRIVAVLSSSNTTADNVTKGGFGTLIQPSGALINFVTLPSGTRRFSLSESGIIYLLAFTNGSGFDYDTRSYIRARRVR
jgi:hypothetical protein